MRVSNKMLRTMFLLTSFGFLSLIGVCGIRQSQTLAQETPAQPAAAPQAAAPAQPSTTPVIGSLTDKVWEFNPYKVTVWIAIEDSPLVSPTTQQEIADRVAWIAEQVDLSSWIVTAQLAPVTVDSVAMRKSMLNGLDSVTLPEAREKRIEMAPGADKVIMISVGVNSSDFEIHAREYDVLSDRLGPIQQNTCLHTHRLAQHCYQALADAFQPMARIQDSDERTATLLPRAVGLIMPPADGNEFWVPPPTVIKDSDILIPMVRHTGRLQLNRPEVEVKAWTCLVLDHREEDEMVCTVQSMFRTPLAGRAARRQQRIALVAKPGYETTRVALVSTDPERRPLWGYRVFRVEKDPETGEEMPVLVGKTDWRGEIEINIADGMFQTLYVKNGERVLGRMPLVVGYEPRVEAPVLADDIRLRAEGVIQGLQSQFLDLVARREVLAKRARYRIEEKEFDGARELINEIRELPTSEQFTLTIEQQRRQVVSDDRREQAKIDAMFNRLIELLAKYIDDGQVEALDGELQAAETAAGVTPGAGAGTAPATPEAPPAQ